MAAMVRIEFDAKEAERALAQLGAKVSRVIPRALNRAGISARTVMLPLLKKDLGLKSGTVRDRISIVKASATHQVVTLRASAKRIPLIEFNATGPEPSYGRGRGVSAKSQGGRKRYPHAFIATMNTGHRGVFQRVGPRRLPIRQLYGPSIAHVFLKHVAVGQERGREALLKNLQSEMKFALSQ